MTPKSSLLYQFGRFVGVAAVLVGGPTLCLAQDDTIASLVQPACVPAPSGLVSWWRAEGNGNDAVVNNNGVAQGSLAYATGEVGQGFVLNGAAADLKIPASTSLNVGAGTGLTFEAWIYPSNLNFQTIAEWNNGGGGIGAHLWISASPGGSGPTGDLYANLIDSSGGSHGISTAGGIITSNSFQHVALTYDKTTGMAVLYRNGVAVQTANFGTLTPQTTFDFYLGTRVSGYGAGNNFKGAMDEATLYNRALSASEIIAIYNAGSAGKCAPVTPPSCTSAPSGLVSWWPGQGNVNDVVGANNGVAQGALAYGAGKVGQGFSLNGTDASVQIPASSTLNVGTAAGLTIETWIKPADVSFQQPLVEWNSAAFANPYGVHFWLSDTDGTGPGCLYGNIIDTSGGEHRFWSAPGLVSNNVFQHVALSYDKASGVAVIYLNGAVVAQQTLGSFTPQTTYDLYLGVRAGGAGYGIRYVGQMDEVSLYNRALSASEIQAIYNAGSAGKCAPATPPTPIPAPSGLVHWWRAESNALDSVGTNNGTLTGTTAYAPGKVGQAFTFDGVNNSSVGVPASPSLNLGLGAGLTIETWINPSSYSLSPWQPIAEWYSTTAGNPYGVEISLSVLGPNQEAAGALFASLPDTGGNNHYFATAPGVVALNSYQHVALTYDKASGQAVLYLNGVAVAQQNLGSFTPQTGYDFYVGYRPGGYRYAGQIDEPSLYNRALSASDIQAIYNAGGAGKAVMPPSFLQGLVAYYPLDGSANDASGNGNNGTLAGVAAFGSDRFGNASGCLSLPGATGVDAAMDVPSLSNLPYTPVTYSAWFKINGYPAFPQYSANDMVLLGREQCGDQYQGSICIFSAPGDSTNQLRYYTGLDAEAALLVPPLNQWCQVALTITSNGIVNWYFDGTNVPSIIGPKFNPTTSLPLNFRIGAVSPGGCGSPGLGVWNGLIDDVRIYNRPLSATEVQQLYTYEGGAITAPQTNCTPAPAGLVSWWRAESNALDSVDSNNGALMNGAGFAAGEVAQAFSLNGVNQYVSVPDSPSLRPTSLTVEGWIKVSASGPVWVIAAKTYGSGTADSFAVWYDNGFLRGGINAPNALPPSLGYAWAPVLRTWHHVAYTFDAGTSAQVLYLDGAPVATGVVSGPILYDSHPVLLGADIEGGNLAFVMNGLLDEMSLCSRALSATEVAAIYTAGSAGKCAPPPPVPVCVPTPGGLTDWWPAEESANDVVGTNNGVLVGGATYAPGKVGMGFSVNDGSSQVTFGTRAGNFRTNDFSVEFWLQTSSTATSYVLGKRAICNISSFWDIQTWGSGPETIRLSVCGATRGLMDIVGHTIINDGRFHHVAVTRQGTRLQLFLDGVLDAYGNSTDVIDFNNTAPMGIGTDACAGVDAPRLVGVVDELSLYNRALTAAEVQAIYTASTAGKCSAPAAPVILSQPANQTVYVGGTAVFAVGAVGSPTLGYQWKHAGTNVTGATNAALVLPNAQMSQAGNYAVVVTGNLGSPITSSNAVLTVLVVPPPCLPAPSGLVHWWRAESNANDSVGTNNGTLTGTVNYAPGEVGQAFNYDGVNNSSVVIPSSPSLNLGLGGGLTIETWIKPSSYSSSPWQPIFEWYSTSAGNPYGVHLSLSVVAPYQEVAGALYANLVDTSGTYHYFATAPGVVALNSFQHVALTYDKASGLAVIYLNGTPIAQKNLGTFTPQTGAGYDVYLGYRPGGYRFAGEIDETSLYNRALSAAEIQAVYTADGGGKCQVPPAPCVPTPAGIVSWWPGEGNVQDIVSGNNGLSSSGLTFGQARVGQGMVFDGQGGGVPLGNPANLQLQDFTIEAWVKRGSASVVSYNGYGAGFVFAYGYGGYGLLIDPTGQPILNKTAVNSVGAGTTITDTNFHHLAVTKSGSVVVFYIDGVARPAPAYNPGFVFTTPAAIGSRGDYLSDTFFGTVDELSIYNRALTAAEVQAIYAADGGGKCTLPPIIKPYITSQPTNQTGMVGGVSTFAAEAGGTEPFSYQWQLNSNNIPGATNASISLLNVQYANAGLYRVLVSNSGGSVTSSNALLSVLALPSITDQPRGQSVNAGADLILNVGVDAVLPPVTSGGLRLWLKGDAGVVTNSDGMVSQWQDQSGNTNDAFQADTNLQPLLVSSAAMGGRAAVRFDGIQVTGQGDYLRGTGDVGIPDAYTSFLVYLLSNNTNREIVPAGVGIPPLTEQCESTALSTKP